MKYVIIGNGILALSTAFRLTQKIGSSDTISIIGPVDRIGSATLAAAAMQNSFGEIESHSLRSETDLYHFELSHLATRMWPDFEKELIDAAGDNLPDGCAKCEVLTGGCYGQGTYIINNTASDELDDKNFDAIVTALKDLNEQFDYVEPKDIPNYHPSQRYRATRAIYIYNEGWLNPRLVVEKIDAILDNHDQVERIDAKVERLIKSGSVIEAIELENGQMVDGDVFLLATGASVGEIVEKSAIGLNIQPIFHGIGVSLEIKAPGNPHEKCIRTPNRGGACGIYTVPFYLGPDEDKDHILIGASNFLSPTPVYNGRLVSISHLMKSAINEINANFYNAQLIRTNVGWRPTTQDTYPLMGRTSIKNLVMATGTKRDGFHLSPVISQMIASIMCDEPVDERFECFAPERELIRDLSREDAIEIGVVSLMSEQYQHDYNPSNIRMNEQVRETYRKDLEELHDKVGAVDWGIPPELVNMYRQGHAK